MKVTDRITVLRNGVVTGELDTKDANEAIKAIRGQVRSMFGDKVADEIIILYGGSVNAANSKD